MCTYIYTYISTYHLPLSLCAYICTHILCIHKQVGVYMYMHVCIYVCMHANTSVLLISVVCMYLCMYVCTYVRMHAYVRVRIYICNYVYTSACWLGCVTLAYLRAGLSWRFASYADSNPSAKPKRGFYQRGLPDNYHRVGGNGHLPAQGRADRSGCSRGMLCKYSIMPLALKHS